MDSEFTARNLGEPQQGAEPDPRPVDAAETDERTNVLPERESRAAPPPRASQPADPSPVNQRAAPWERHVSISESGGECDWGETVQAGTDHSVPARTARIRSSACLTNDQR